MNIMKTKTTVLNLPARAAMTLLALMLTSLSAWAADQSGRCGTNLWYRYYTSTQALYIYIGDQGSTGYMTNYYPDDDYYHDKAPWKNYRGEMETLYLINTLWIADFRNYLRFFVTTVFIRGSAGGVV